MECEGTRHVNTLRHSRHYQGQKSGKLRLEFQINILSSRSQRCPTKYMDEGKAVRKTRHRYPSVSEESTNSLPAGVAHFLRLRHMLIVGIGECRAGAIVSA